MILNVKTNPVLLSAEEVEEIERQRRSGISSQEVIALFQNRGIRLSEATFRKYVQLGLVPTSRRVGRKGKHRGSCGVYPISVVRRINLIKSMMMEDMKLEEIRDSFLLVQNEIEKVQTILDELFLRLNDRLSRLRLEREGAQHISKALVDANKNARTLMSRLEKIGTRLAIASSPSNPEDQGGLP